MNRTLGTQLRTLLELLDGAVERAYEKLGLDYRPRYTPIMRVLIDRRSASVGEIAEAAGISQPSATQTIGIMANAGLVAIGAGVDDARKRVVRLTAKGRALVPALQSCWMATAVAAESLDRELDPPLGPCLEAALAALARRSYDERIQQALQTQQ